MVTISEIDGRTIDLACYIIENNATIRIAADHFGIGKSTAHSDLSERLPRINPALYSELRVVLNRNYADRQVRGGQAIRRSLRAKRHAGMDDVPCN